MTTDHPPHTPLSYEPSPGPHAMGEWAGLVRAVAYLGLGIGAARLIWAWGYLPIEQNISLGWLGWRELFPLFTNGIVMGFIGAGLIAACVAALLRKDWAPILLLLNEQMAVILFLIIMLTELSVVVVDPNQAAQRPYLAAWQIGEMLLNVGYPILAVAIFRTRAVRRWFHESPVALAPVLARRTDEAMDDAVPPTT